jgi:hypothetical protein
MSHPEICYHCSNTGFIDWAEKQEEPCPKGCKPPAPLTPKQREAWRRRIELIGEYAQKLGLEDTERHFTKMLFCGAGDKTRHDVAWLHDRVEVALNYLSGRQQGPHWREQPSQEMLDQEEASTQKADLVCQEVARDIAMALTGKEITFVE